MDSFTFYLEELGGSGTTVQFQAAVYAWDPVSETATGSAVAFEDISLTGTASYQAVTANLSGANLTSGGEYVALFTITDPASLAANGNLDAAFLIGLTSSSTINDGGGYAVWDDNTASSQLVGSSWSGTSGSAGSLAWTATFSEVPEPSVMALAGLGAVAFLFRRRTSRK